MRLISNLLLIDQKSKVGFSREWTRYRTITRPEASRGVFADRSIDRSIDSKGNRNRLNPRTLHLRPATIRAKGVSSFTIHPEDHRRLSDGAYRESFVSTTRHSREDDDRGARARARGIGIPLSLASVRLNRANDDEERIVTFSPRSGSTTVEKPAIPATRAFRVHSHAPCAASIEAYRKCERLEGVAHGYHRINSMGARN